MKQEGSYRNPPVFSGVREFDTAEIMTSGQAGVDVPK
jgi:hypothetical protein